jgi:hypothetical protein
MKVNGSEWKGRLSDIMDIYKDVSCYEVNWRYYRWCDSKVLFAIALDLS